MGLYGNTFITGQALADDRSTLYAVDAGMYPLENSLRRSSSTCATRPCFRKAGYGESWHGSATVETITGIFALGPADRRHGQQHDGRQLRSRPALDRRQRRATVTTWNGTAVLDNAANSINTTR